MTQGCLDQRVPLFTHLYIRHVQEQLINGFIYSLLEVCIALCVHNHTGYRQWPFHEIAKTVNHNLIFSHELFMSVAYSTM